MKVWYLLLIGIFSVYCQSSSSTYNPPVSRVAKQPNRNGKEGIFSRISETIGAYARVTIGLHILGELIEPTSENLAIGAFMNINESIVDAWMAVNGKDSKFIIKEIASINSSGFQVNGFLTEIAAFEDIFIQFEKLPPIHTEQQFTEMGQIVKNWQSVTDFPLTRLQALEEEVNAVVKHSKSTDHDTKWGDDLEKLNDKAMRAMKLYPQELETVANHLKMFNGVFDFTDLYGPIKERIEIIKAYQNREVSSLTIGNLAELQKIFKQSTTFKVGSRIAQMIQLLTRMDDTSSLGRIWSEVFRNEFTELTVLKEDLDSQLLKDTLNKGEDLEVLKKVLNPIFDIGKIVSVFWTDSDAIFKDNDFRTHIDAIEPLLTNMADVESPNFNKSVAAVEKMFNLSAIPDELNSFVDHYDEIITKIEEYQKILENVEEYQKEEEYQKGLKMIENVDEWSVAYTNDKDNQGKNQALHNKISENKYSPFSGSTITKKFEEFNSKLKTFRDSLSKVNFTSFPNTGVKLLTDVTNTLNKTLMNNKVHLSQIKAALNFVKTGQGNGGNKFDELVTKLSKLETIMNEKRKQLDTERKKLKDSPDAEFYKEVLKLNQGFDVKKKLVAGSNLFKIFDRIVKDTKFDDFFKAGDALYKKIQEVPFSNKNRFKWILKMKKLNTIKSRYEELKKVILVRKSRYNNVTMENLMQLRWLIENLYELPNPELKVEEWKQFAGLEPLKNVSGGELTNFEKAIEGISDLNFAEYQKHVPNTYAHLRALIRFHNAILATEKVSSKTFWDWNHQWIEIVGFVAITLVLNVLAYGGAALYIRKKNATPEELAERKTRKERKKLEAEEEPEEKAKTADKTDPNSKAKGNKRNTTNVKARR